MLMKSEQRLLVTYIFTVINYYFLYNTNLWIQLSKNLPLSVVMPQNTPYVNRREEE